MAVQTYFKVGVDNKINNDYLFGAAAEAIDIANILQRESSNKKIVVFGFNRYPEEDKTPVNERVIFWECYQANPQEMEILYT